MTGLYRNIPLMYVLWVICFILSHTVVSSSGSYDSPADRFIVATQMRNDSPLSHLAYCNRHYTISGQEGHCPPGYRLTGAHVVLTPGESYSWHSHSPGLQFSPACAVSTDSFSTYKIHTFQEVANIYKTVQTERHLFKDFHPVFQKKCSKEHLTNSGMKQLIATGEHLYTLYFTKLKPESLHIHAESLPNQKSYQSTLSLLHGMLPEKVFVKTRVYKTSDNFCDTTESDLTSCRCDIMHDLVPYVMQALDEGKYLFKDSIPDLDRLKELFGDFNINSLSSLKLFKMIRHARCYGLFSICNDYGQCFNLTQLIEKEIINMSSAFLDRLFFDGTFRQFSEVTTYPFLQRLVYSMTVAPESFGVYTGTEHYLEFLQTSLGISRDTLLPVASRVAFELYQKDKSSQPKESAVDSDSALLRVLLNGADVTDRVRGCQGRLQDGLCPGREFKIQVSALRQQYIKKC